MRTPEEAYSYLHAPQILLYTRQAIATWKNGSLRCDANVSVRLRGAKEFGTKVEVKNLNSFPISKSPRIQIERHIAVLESGARSRKKPALNQASHRPMRSKEKANDIAIFRSRPAPHPRQPCLARRSPAFPPELPDQAHSLRHLLRHHALRRRILTNTPALADFFESVVQGRRSGKPPQLMQTELLRAQRIRQEISTAHRARCPRRLVKSSNPPKSPAPSPKKFSPPCLNRRTAADIVAAKASAPK